MKHMISTHILCHMYSTLEISLYTVLTPKLGRGGPRSYMEGPSRASYHFDRERPLAVGHTHSSLFNMCRQKHQHLTVHFNLIGPVARSQLLAHCQRGKTLKMHFNKPTMRCQYLATAFISSSDSKLYMECLLSMYHPCVCLGFFRWLSPLSVPLHVLSCRFKHIFTSTQGYV